MVYWADGNEGGGTSATPTARVSIAELIGNMNCYFSTHHYCVSSSTWKALRLCNEKTDSSDSQKWEPGRWGDDDDEGETRIPCWDETYGGFPVANSSRSKVVSRNVFVQVADGLNGTRSVWFNSIYLESALLFIKLLYIYLCLTYVICFHVILFCTLLTWQ